MRVSLILVGLFCWASLAFAAGGAEKRGHSASPREHPLIQQWVHESGNFLELVEKLERDFNKYGHSSRMIRAIFHRAHRQLFQGYRQYTLDRDAVEEGWYDCVSGSFVLAGILDAFGFDFDILETSYHVFLSVKADDDEILLEVTDPLGGVISGQTGLKDYLEQRKILENQEDLGDDIGARDGKWELGNSISIENLLGLLYFNQAVRYFNGDNLLAAYQFSATAIKYHSSARLMDFHAFLKDRLTVVMR